MIGLARLLERPGFHVLLLLSSVTYLIVRCLPVPYMDHDVLIYTLVGEGIYRDGILPYGLIFDHKPFLTYFLYGPLAFLNSSLNIFALFSVVWLLVLASIVHTFLLMRTVPFLLTLFVLSVATLGNVSYSGNSEIVYVPFELLSVGLALGSANRPVWLVFSAAAAVAATSVNYISGLPLLPTLLYALYVSSSTSGRFLLRAPVYLLTSIVILGVAFILLAFAGTDVGEYLLLQRRFLSGYAGIRAEPSLRFLFLVGTPFLALGLALLMPGLSVKPQFRRLSTAMLLLAVVSASSFFMSGKFYNHYAFMVTAPIAVILLSLDYSRPWLRAVFSLVLVAAALAQLAPIIVGRSFLRTGPDLYGFYGPLAELVEDQPLMSMHASVVPLYFSELRPFHSLVWFDHAEIIYGTDADAYYAGLLDRQPPFVMTSIDWCKNDGDAWAACDILEANYDEVQSRHGQWPIEGYTLYQLK